MTYGHSQEYTQSATCYVLECGAITTIRNSGILFYYHIIIFSHYCGMQDIPNTPCKLDSHFYWIWWSFFIFANMAAENLKMQFLDFKISIVLLFEKVDNFNHGRPQ